MTTMTRHARLDRASRIDKIIDYCKGDFGEIIGEHSRNNKWQVLYSTGIVMIYPDHTKSKLITMYAANLAEITAIYRNTHSGKDLPSKLYKTAIRLNKIQQSINK